MMNASNILNLVVREASKNKTTAKPFRCTVDTCPLEYAIINYQPNFACNTIYGVCFVILFFAQLFFGIRKKTWTYMSAVCLGIFGEIVGYIGRLMLHKNPFDMNNFLVYLVPLTIAPALLTGGIYVCLSRVIVVVGADYSRIKPKMYTYIFVGCDLLSLILQSIGGAIASMGGKKEATDLGVHIMIAGLISQIVSMIIFFVLWGDFVLRVRKAKAAGNLDARAPLYDTLRAINFFHLFQWSLFLATLLIFIRSVYRVAELWNGFSSHLANDEVTFMIFEGPMIIAAVTLMTVFHPGRVFDDLWIAAGKGYRFMRQGDTGSTDKVEVIQRNW
ncbi:RTA1-domain-containing protein [Bimuria novae-zelandiae CBS 107.79]|uniref:RTA1-domain-containing protein n=1 Tax=Bimuria novae-zelandiae CBS 107.79 TaxID=1447943 RepID=A0A6A5VER2_9PLEO|nr:RTA1-domain-containing protein [Bimuria novae-zelandiae CBS 107.79]